MSQLLVLTLMTDRLCRIAWRYFLTLAIVLGLVAVPVIAVSSESSTGHTLKEDTHVFNVLITCRDSDTGTGIAGVRVYLDGEFRGVTAGKEGKIVVVSLPTGEHTVRTVGRGYMENTSSIRIPTDEGGNILMHPAKIIPIGKIGPVEDRMDVVFVPSRTQYDCAKKEKISTDYYTANEENFRNDVDNLVEKLRAVNSLTRNQSCLPEDTPDRFNFYYYSDPGDYADAFSGCAGTLPEDFWEDAPFTDVAVIIYPQYTGKYTGPPCEPNGCSSSMGPGIHSWFKSPANNGPVFLHEAGHAVFGLMDTYCGETYYAQNDPRPNVWSSQSACIQSAKSNNWDPTHCRQILQKANNGTILCQKEFWRYDPDPDMMSYSLFIGKFGNATTLHIHQMLDNINRWNP